jgi:hypothetical protein
MRSALRRRSPWILVACIAATLSLHGQTSSTTDRADTTDNRVRLIDPGISSGRPVFLLPPSLSIIPGDFGDPETIGLGTPPPFLGDPVTGKIDLIAPFKLQLEKQKELQTLRSVLGTVQVGAVAYLAYKQIRRWGKK